MSNSFESSKDAKRIEEIMEASFEKNRLKWLTDHEFNENGDTYIVGGETYSIKNELKSAGFQYHPDLGWHKSQPVGFEDRLIKINIDEIAEKSVWGEYHFVPNIKIIIWEKTKPNNSLVGNSEWVGEINKRMPATKVKLTQKKLYNSIYGLQNIYTFETEEGNILTWFTTCNINKEINEQFFITFKIKAHNIYKNNKQTLITRAKIKEDN